MSVTSNTPKGSIVVTGASGGLGSAIVSQIASTQLGRDYHGLYTVRNPATADSVNVILQRAPAHAHELVALDLSSLASVRDAAAVINKKVAEGTVPPIQALILNAGYQDSAALTMSDDGFEMSFQVNYLSHFLFTLLVLRSMEKESGRVLVVGSWSHDASDPRNDMGSSAGAYKGEWKTLFTDTESLARGRWSAPAEKATFHDAYRRYGAAKLCEIMFMLELQKRLASDPSLGGISVLGLDPGAMSTGLMRHAKWLNRTLAMTIGIPLTAGLATRLQKNPMMRTTAKSAADALRACFDTAALGERPAGVYLDGTRESETGAEARDEGKRRVLWRDSVRLVELREEETVLRDWK